MHRLCPNYIQGVVLVLCAIWNLQLPAQTRERPVAFNRDIRPLLVDKCFACHGPDAETVAGGLRLDLRDAAIGAGAIEPGVPDDSEMLRRIFSEDEGERMPPPDSHKELKPLERDLIRRWILDGAEYRPHWAYTKLSQPHPPKVAAGTDSDWAEHWVINPIDQFVAANLIQESTAPSPTADRVALIRRLSVDLTGLPPTMSEVKAFIDDETPEAYEDLAKRLLDSPRFGERMAVYWLDLVRYADTVGYHGDQDTSQSPYRDYVINAFNSDLPYSQFVTEQLAGDLLPDPTLDQRVATGYNRLNQTTEEGGAQAKEYLAIYFADRVRNVSQVFMGATVGCAQCHDHKFDPYTAKDFYSLGAFFADVEEVGKYEARSRPPVIPVPNEQQRQQIAELDQQIKDQRQAIRLRRTELVSNQAAWEQEILAQAEPLSREVQTVWIDDQQDTGGTTSGKWDFVNMKVGPVHQGKKSRRQQSDALEQHFFINAKTKITVEPGTQFFAWAFVDPENPPMAIMLQLNDGTWDHRAVWGSDEISYGLRPENWAGYMRQGKLPPTGQWIRLEIAAADIGLTPGSEVNGMAFTQYGGLIYWDEAGAVSKAGLPTNIYDALKLTPKQRSAEVSRRLTEHYLSNAEPILKLNSELAATESKRQQILESATQTVITKSVTPRSIRVLHRGNWMDDSGEVVQPAIPEFLGRLETGDRAATRLDLANWLCDSDNVLTSRTMTNRLWYLMFGRGICTSVDDLGGQGTYPANPELLDWLAVDFVNSGWDVKHTLRTIVTSATYRQSSRPSPDLRAKDPYNDLFARQGRFRIDAEAVRDGALAISGLLVEQVGGESAKPYQPDGYYAQLNFPERTYLADKDRNQYRRGVYTHWQRTFLHPMLKAFDAPSREESTCSRSRSNTPLQALTLLNDPTFVEAARVFAERIMREGGATTEDRIGWAYQLALSRPPTPAVAMELKGLFDQHLAEYQGDSTAAGELVATGNSETPTDIDVSELAAWTSVARVVLNLHETITRY